MSKSNPIRMAVAALAGAACFAPCAIAAAASPAAHGEAKNVVPFIDPYSAPRPSVRFTASTPQNQVPQGEAKNGTPFTSIYSEDPGLALAYAKIAKLEAQVTGESKNTPPFTDAVVSVGSGFHWLDASIGALAGVGVCLLAAGAIASRHSGFRRRTPVSPVSPRLFGRSAL